MKKDNLGNEEKFEMKGIKKAALALGLAGIMAGSFVACGKSGENSSNSNSISNSSEYSTEIEDSSSSEILPDSSLDSSDSSEKEDSSSSIEEKDEIPYEAIQSFIAEVGASSYTYVDQSGNTSHMIDGEKMYVSTNGAIGNFYFVEDAQMYKLTYDSAEKIWNKTVETELTDFGGFVYDALVSTDWKEYNKEENIVSGVSGGLDYSLDLDDGTLSGELAGQISEIGNSEVVMPHSSIIVDKTQGDPVASENIYEVVDGEYVFDVVAIKDVLLNWMQGDNQFGKDVLARKYNGDFTTLDIPYVKASQEKIEFGFTYSDGTNKYFRSAYLWNDDLYQKIASQDLKSKESFMTKLKELKIGQLSMTRDQITIDTEISASDFDILTKNAFERLENKGTQGTSINNDYPETKLEGFSEAEVMFGFKTTRSGESAGYDMGFGRGWKQYYILKYKGSIEFVRCSIISSTSNNVTDELQNVLNNNENWWLVSSIEREELNNENEKLYDDNSTALLNNMSAKSKTNTDVILMSKKEREFC